MKKLLGLLVVAGAAATLSACNSAIPTCYDELNECGHGMAYTEEKTAQTNPARKNWAKKTEVMAVPEAVPMPAPEPAPIAEPVVAPPAPEPEPIVMQSAEPQFTQISK